MSTDQKTAARLSSVLGDMERSVVAPDGLEDRLLDALHSPPINAERPRPARTRLLPLLAAALVAAVIVGLAATGTFRSRSDPAGPPARPRTTQQTFLGIHFPVPDAWKTIRFRFITPGIYQIAVITNRPGRVHCSPRKGCHGSERPGPGGIVVHVAQDTPFIGHFRSNTSVAGLPARRTRPHCRGTCRPWKAQQFSLTIRLPHSAQPLSLTVDLGTRAQPTLRTFNAMVRKATFH